MKIKLRDCGFLLLGITFGLIGLFLLRKSNALVFINENAPAFGLLLTLILIGITAIYVVLTYRLVKETSKSVEQVEKQWRRSNIPMVVAEFVDSEAKAIFRDKKRYLFVHWKIKNVGGGPAIQIYIRGSLIFKFVQFEYVENRSEYRFISNMGITGEEKIELRFSQDKVDKMIEDFSIYFDKKKEAEKNKSQKVFETPDLAIEIIFSNVHGQWFRSKLVSPLLALDAYNRGRDYEDRYIYFFNNNHIKGDERFRLVLKNPTYQKFYFDPINNGKANDFIKQYGELLN